MALALVGILACSAPPAPPAPPRPPPAPAPVATTPEPVSCADAGVILRGAVEDDRLAAPEKEATIARACLRGKWPAEVLACIGSSRQPPGCLDQLTAEQRAGYLKLLAGWNDLFPDEEVPELDRRADEDEADVEPVDCVSASATAEHLAPKLTQTGADRRFATLIRGDAVELACEDWSNAIRRCFEDADATSIERCRAMLEPDQKKQLADALADTDALLARIAAIALKPATAACAKVVAVHYSDAEWKARGPRTTPKTAGLRKKMIADSRAAMKRACAADRWSLAMRACIVAGARDKCFIAAGESMVRWSFPAAGVIVKSGIPECDAYGVTLQKLAACTGMPKRSIEALQGTFAQQSAAYATGTAAERAAAGPQCKQADEAIRRAAQTFNCTI